MHCLRLGNSERFSLRPQVGLALSLLDWRNLIAAPLWLLHDVSLLGSKAVFLSLDFTGAPLVATMLVGFVPLTSRWVQKEARDCLGRNRSTEVHVDFHALVHCVGSADQRRSC